MAWDIAFERWITVTALTLAAGAGAQTINPGTGSGGGGATTPATTQLYKGNGSTNGVVAASPGTDYVVPSQLNSPASSSALGAVQLPAGQTSTTLATSAITGQFSDIIASQSLSAYSTVRQVRPENYYFSGTGFTYGSGGALSPQSNYHNWAGDNVYASNVFCLRQDICQYSSLNMTKYALGDAAGIYMYLMGVGGTTAASDQGQNPLAINSGEIRSYFQGVVASSTATGATTISVTPQSFNSYFDPHLCDGCFFVSKTASYTGHFTGAPVAVTDSTSGAILYWTVTTDQTFSVSVSGTLLGCGGTTGAPIPQTSAPQTYQSDTCTFGSVTGSGFSASTNGGIATISGQFTEQAQITSVGALSGGQQSVTFLHKDTNAVHYTMLWQGGIQGTGETADYQEAMAASGLPLFSTIFGSTSANTFAAGVAHLGKIDAPGFMFHQAQFYGGGRNSGNIVTVYRVSPFENYFSGGISGVVSGCTDSTMNGAVTNITESQNILTWTSPNSGSTSCGATGTLTLSPAVQSFHIYPYAQQIAGDPAVAVFNADGTLNQTATNANFAATRTVTLEKNNITLTNGAVVMEPHPPIMDGSSILLSNYQYGTHPGHQMNSLQIVTNGAGQTGGNKTLPGTPVISVTNSDRLAGTHGIYVGDGGLTIPPLVAELAVPNYGTFHTQAPIGGNVAPWALIDCPFTDPACLEQINVFKTNNVNWLTYLPQSQTALFPNLQATTVTVSGLTPGNCVQVGTGGLLTTTGSACGSGGGGGPIVNSGHATMTTGTVNVTFVRTFASTAYDCTTTDTTTTALSHDVPASRSTTGTTIVGNGTDTVSYTCIAN